MRRSRSRPAVIITDAPQSPAEELRSRQTRYIVMMLARAACLVLAAVLAMLRVPLLGLWVIICLLGAVLLPWFAVLLANDRAPKPQYRLSARRRARGATPAAEPAQPALTERPGPKVIDIDP